MAERQKIVYGPKTRALKFLKGRVFGEPSEDIYYAKFVRIGKLVVVSPDGEGVSHAGLITEPGLDAGDKAKFILTARKLADTGSAQIDAGVITVSLGEQTIILRKQSYGLCPERIVPVNSAARDISREIVEALSPGFTVIAGI